MAASVGQARRARRRGAAGASDGEAKRRAPGSAIGRGGDAGVLYRRSLRKERGSSDVVYIPWGRREREAEEKTFPRPSGVTMASRFQAGRGI